MENSKKGIFILISILFVVVTILSLTLGVVPLSLSEIIEAISQGMNGNITSNIFWHVRLPRTLACIFAGAGLATSGMIIQKVLGNKLASSNVIGINAAAALAVTICLALGVVSGWVISLSAFLASLISIFIIVFVASKIKASSTTVILGGVALNSFFNACCEAINTLFPEVTMMSIDFRVGGFASATLTKIIPAAILMMIAFIILLTLCNELDILSLGEESAQGLGLSVKKMRAIFLILAALLAGASVSFAGLLGFVGLIIPHIARKMVKEEARYLLPFCMILGATFVMFCDLISRLIFQPYEIPVGILMSFIGGPFFVFLLLNKKGGHNYD